MYNNNNKQTFTEIKNTPQTNIAVNGHSIWH